MDESPQDFTPRASDPRYRIPAGTRPWRCRGCPELVYSVPDTKAPITVRYADGRAPTATADGEGVSHFLNCPKRDRFSAKGKQSGGSAR